MGEYCGPSGRLKSSRPRTYQYCLGHGLGWRIETNDTSGSVNSLILLFVFSCIDLSVVNYMNLIDYTADERQSLQNL